MGKVQKGPQKILSLHFRLILSTGTAYRKQKILEKGENLISRVRFKCPTFNKKTWLTKKQKARSIQRKK